MIKKTFGLKNGKTEEVFNYYLLIHLMQGPPYKGGVFKTRTQEERGEQGKVN